ncbi:MAG: iron-containing alcohol dehydrogenase [Clostridia bacterium]|nr:iron-containing alcohol dehydrogenase [Clostridia bacterium]
MTIFNDGTKVVECESIFEQLIPQCGEALKAGHISVVKGASTGDNAIELLRKAGYKVTVIEVDKKSLFSYNTVAAKILGEESRLVVGIGEDYVMDSAKVIASSANVPLILVPITFSGLCALQRRAEFFCDGSLISYYLSNPAIVLLCKDFWAGQKAKEFSQGLGYMLSYLVWTVDALYEGIIHNKGINAKTLQLLRYLVKCFGKLNSLENCNNADVVIKAAIEISALVSELEVKSISAFSLAWFISLYKKEKISYNNYTFIAAYAILQLYCNTPDMPDMLLPADRDRALRELEKCCGLDYSEELRQTKIGYAEDYNRRCFVTQDYREELQNLIRGEWLKNCARYYRRLQGSSGYSMCKIISGEELLKLLSLSGEACGGYPLLKHIKLTGLLERYL